MRVRVTVKKMLLTSQPVICCFGLLRRFSDASEAYSQLSVVKKDLKHGRKNMEANSDP
jgi:hypothetical protein